MNILKKRRGAHKNAKSKTGNARRKAERRAVAEHRLELYQKLSIKEKIARLPVDGAKRQRARLMRQVAA